MNDHEYTDKLTACHDMIGPSVKKIMYRFHFLEKLNIKSDVYEEHRINTDC